MAENTGIPDDTAHDSLQDAEQLLPVFYDELCRLARARIVRLDLPGQTLTPTELVHEIYLRVVGISFESRRHFFFVACRTMRDIMVESDRRSASLKRGGDYLRVDLEDVAIEGRVPREDILDLNHALQKLEREKPDSVKVVRLRYFGGLSIPEIAEVEGCSQATVKRRWSHARAWLQRVLSQSPSR